MVVVVAAREWPNGAGEAAARACISQGGLFQCVCALRTRDVGEGLVRARLLELELKLLRAENGIISERLEAWSRRVRRMSP